jgi:hypothetical protein
MKGGIHHNFKTKSKLTYKLDTGKEVSLDYNDVIGCTEKLGDNVPFRQHYNGEDSIKKHSTKEVVDKLKSLYKKKERIKAVQLTIELHRDHDLLNDIDDETPDEVKIPIIKEKGFRKEATGTTNNGRILLGSRDMEKPRSADANWRLWKLAKECRTYEIEALYTIKLRDKRWIKKEIQALRKTLKKTKEEDKEQIKERISVCYDEIKRLDKDLKILSGARIIRKRKDFNERLERIIKFQEENERRIAKGLRPFDIKKEILDMELLGGDYHGQGVYKVRYTDDTQEYISVAIDEENETYITYSNKQGGNIYNMVEPIELESEEERKAGEAFGVIYEDEEQYTYVKGGLREQYKEIEEHMRQTAKRRWGLDFNLWGELTAEQKEILNDIEERYVREMLEAKKKAEEEESKKRKHRESQQRYKEQKKKGD